MRRGRVLGANIERAVRTDGRRVTPPPSPALKEEGLLSDRWVMSDSDVEGDYV